MTKHRAAGTGPGAMALVALEQGFPPSERILTDDLALAILPFPSRARVRLFLPLRGWLVDMTERKVPGLWGGIMARKRAIDDMIVANPAEAVVNLGAGFDTRAYRLPALAKVPVWEVDLPRNIEPKRRRLQQLFGRVPAHVSLVPIDFDEEDLGPVLARHGHPADSPTFFIWEGVTQYLKEAGVRATLESLSKAPPRSRLAFTYTPKDFIDGQNLHGQPHLHRKMVGKDPVWHFGIDPGMVDGLLAEYGWDVVEHLGYDELDERYVRPTGRGLGWMAIERLVHAVRRPGR
jgi:methyltransferase (TIGR00027 family)